MCFIQCLKSHISTPANITYTLRFFLTPPTHPLTTYGSPSPSPIRLPTVFPAPSPHFLTLPSPPRLLAVYCTLPPRLPECLFSYLHISTPSHMSYNRSTSQNNALSGSQGFAHIATTTNQSSQSLTATTNAPFTNLQAAGFHPGPFPAPPTSHGFASSDPHRAQRSFLQSPVSSHIAPPPQFQ